MAVERLASEDTSISYHSYFSAQHVVRYAAVKDIVAGKRVLDVACGEGYGARLLLAWGAREVVGVEISPDAVATARRRFGGEGATFLVGDVEALDQVLDGAAPFDLVVSLETIEHLERPDDFLASLSGILAPGGAIVISCPNDPAHGDNDNSSHMKTYSFEDFRSLTERHLGQASMWLLGAPLLGEMNFRPGDDFVEHAHDDQAALLETKKVENTLVIPAQSNLTTNEAQCSHYIGIWGAEVCPNAVISSLPVQEYLAPWRQNADLKAQVAEQERRQTDHYEPEIARLSGKSVQLEAAFAEVVAERDELASAKLDLEQSAEQQRSALERSVAEQAELAANIHNELEPVIERLRADALADQQEITRLAEESSRLEVENAELRGERKALSASAEELERRVTQERASVERSLVEQGALATRIRDVFEPQVEQLSSQVSALQRENNRLVKSSNRLQADNSEMRSERKAHFALKAELKAAMAMLDKLEKEKAEYYEPELTRLKSNVEHSKFEKETQMLRRRIMAYADQSRRIGNAVVKLEMKYAELERLRDSWYVPELDRLSAIIEQHEKTKREWFEPQLDSRAAHIAALEQQVHSRDALIKNLESNNAVEVGKSEPEAATPSGRIFRFKR